MKIKEAVLKEAVGHSGSRVSSRDTVIRVGVLLGVARVTGMGYDAEQGMLVIRSAQRHNDREEDPILVPLSNVASMIPVPEGPEAPEVDTRQAAMFDEGKARDEAGMGLTNVPGGPVASVATPLEYQGGGSAPKADKGEGGGKKRGRPKKAS